LLGAIIGIEKFVADSMVADRDIESAFGWPVGPRGGNCYLIGRTFNQCEGREPQSFRGGPNLAAISLGLG
jgi:hypothetical protein